MRDLATPVASVGNPKTALDLDLEDSKTGFDPDKLPFYKDALLGLGNLPDKAEDINDVYASIKQIVGIIAQEALSTPVCSTDGRLKFRALI